MTTKAQAQNSVKPAFQPLPFAHVKRLFANPFPGQRSHRLHLQEASYLHGKNGQRTLFADQTVFHAVRYKVKTAKGFKSVTHLVDGYTRIEAILQKLMDVPQEIYLITHTVANYDEAYAVYCQFNSTAAAKKGKHFVQSGVRQATTKPGQIAKDSFESALLVTGPLTSAIIHGGIVGKDLASKTVNGFAALQAIDCMKLKKNGESAGSLAAYVAIMARDHLVQPKLARHFIKGMNFVGNYEPESVADTFIEEARNYHQDKRALRLFSGTKNVQEIRNYILTCYQRFVAQTLRKSAIRPPKSTTLTLGQFLDQDEK